MKDNTVVDVLIIGAQKSATTAIIKNLSTVEDVWGGTKEHHFFSDFYHKGIDWYHSQLERNYKSSSGRSGSIFDNKIVMEKSPSYMSELSSAKRIYDYNPNIKIIASLRNPILRAFSRYQDILVDEPGRITSSFFETISRSIKHNHHFTENGYYARQLKPYFDVFPENNIFISVQERMKANPKIEFDRLGRFALGRPLNIEPKVIHSNPYKEQVDEKTRAVLEEYYKERNQELFELLGAPIPEWIA